MAKKGEAEQPLSTSEIVSLATMLGGGDFFSVGEKRYKVKPLKLKDIDEFQKDAVNVGPQLYSMINEEARSKLEKWLSRQVFDANNEPMTLQKAIDDDWDLSDLRLCVQKIIDLSG